MGLALAAGLSILLGACTSPSNAGPTGATRSPASDGGASTPGSGAATAPSTAAAAGGEIPLAIKNNTFPDEIRVKAGASLVFVVTNRGDENHSFEFPDFKVYKEIGAGQTVRIEWTVPDRKGKWDMGCFLTDPPGVHDGMQGDLIVE